MGADPRDSTPIAGDERDDLLALLAHELRTPLAPLGGFVETVLEHYPDQVGPDAERLLRVAARNAARLQEIVDQVLRTARAVGGPDVVPRDQPLRAAAELVVEHVGGLADAQVDVPADLTVLAGRDQLALLLTELVENAVVHGAPPVVCRARRVGELVEIRVEDHGPGLSRTAAARVFDGFVQDGRSPLRREVAGLGLGLRMVAALVERLGGTITYDDAAPGACFVVELPAGQGRATADPDATATAAVVGAPTTVRRAVTAAHHRMATVERVDDARVVLRDLVENVGGRLVTTTEADATTVLVDLSLGGATPVFGSAEGLAHAALARHLPSLVTMATTVLARGDQEHYDPAQVVDLLAVNAVQPLRRDLDRRFTTGQSVVGIVEDVLRPALEEVGHRWMHGSWTVADEHAATGLVEAVVGSLELRLRHLVPHGTRVTLIGVPGDHHELPRRLLALQLREHDVSVRWIGAATPLGSLARDLDEHPSDVLLLSCGFGPLLGGAIDLARVAADRGIPVIIGGQAVVRHPGVATATGCIPAPPSVDHVVDLLARDLPPVGDDGLPGSWREHAGAVRAALLRGLPRVVAAALTADELGWLVEAVAIDQWEPTHGPAVLEECVDVLVHALRERGEDGVADQLPSTVDQSLPTG